MTICATSRRLSLELRRERARVGEGSYRPTRPVPEPVEQTSADLEPGRFGSRGILRAHGVGRTYEGQTLRTFGLLEGGTTANPGSLSQQLPKGGTRE